MIGLLANTELIEFVMLSILCLFRRVACSAFMASVLSHACVNVSLGLGSMYGCCMVVLLGSVVEMIWFV